MNEILALIESLASHINAGSIEESIELVTKLIHLAETVYPQIKEDIQDAEAKLDYNK